MADNTIKQKIVLNADEYSSTVKKVNTEMKTATDDINKSLTGTSKVLAQNEDQTKKWGKTVGDELMKVGKQFADNLKTGAKAITLDAGRAAIKQAGHDAIGMAFSFSKAFAEIKSKSNASETDLMKWRKSLMQISTDVGSNMDSMAQSFNEMFSSVKDPQELLKIMESVGKAAAMGDGDATKVSGSVMSRLQGEGREVNNKNVMDVLGGQDLLRRNGSGFKDLSAAQDAMGSISGADIKKSKLSERDLAAILAGASKTGSDSATSTKGVAELLGMSNNGLMQGSKLAGILGTGSLTDKNGKFDISKLGGGKAMAGINSLGKNDNERLEVFKSISGMSAEGSEATFNMIKHFKELNETFQQTEHDLKSFDQSAAEGADNLENTYKKFENGLITGVTDILGGFEKPMKSLLKGDVGGAIGGLGGALGQAGKGIAEHPMLVAGGIATTAIAGSLITSLLGKMGGMGGAAGLAAGVAKGDSLKAAGVTPVYVTNASEIGGGGGPGAALGSGMGFMGKLGMVGGAGAAGVAVGTGINYLSDKYGGKNASGQDYGLVEKGIAKIIPEFLGGMSSEQYKQNYTQKVEVEIISKDPAYSGIPRAKDNQRDSRSQ